MTASNLYSEKIFSEHPLAIWPLDDSADYISLITEAQRDINTWTKTNGTVITGSTPVFNGKNQTEPFPDSYRKIFRSTPPVGSNTTSYIKSANLINFQSLNSTLQTFALSTYYYTESTNIVSISIGYEYDGGSQFKDFTVIKSETWTPISATFTFPDLDKEFKFVIKVVSSPGGATVADYNIHFNGITVGQHSEEFNAISLGQTKLSTPASINLSLDAVVQANAYGLNANSGYYVVDNNALSAKNFGVPLVYGSDRAVQLIPHSEVVDYRTWDQVSEESWSYWKNQEESWTDVNYFVDEADLITNTQPSFIFPGYGFLNESGRHNDYTLEVWLQADVNTTDAKRILGPIASTDGLYVKDSFLTLVIDGDFISHFVGEWYRPMLIHIKLIKNKVILLVNGEDVGSLIIDTSLINLPSQYDVLETTKSNDWIALYAHETYVDQIKIDCISLYPYSISTNAAKIHYILGQGIPTTPELIDNYYGGSTVEIDYPFAGYSNNVTYPTTRSWDSGIEDNLVPGISTLKTPDYQLPNFILSSNKTLKDLESSNRLIQDAGSKFFSLKPSGTWGTDSYIYFENLSFISNTIDSIVGTFKLTESQNAIFLHITDGINSFTIRKNSTLLNYVFTYAGVSTTIRSHTCPVGIFTAGIQISKLIENNTTDGLAQFFANPGLLKLYIGSQPSKEDMFTGNIYNVGINTYKHTSFTLDSYFYDDGTFNFSNSIIDHVSSYTLFSFEDYGKFFIDISVFGYWEDYIPLSVLTKDVLDENGETITDIDFIQFNIDYPAPSEVKEIGDTYWVDNNDSINTDDLNVRTYVTFQNISQGITQTDADYATTSPAIKKRILNLNTEADWQTKRFEIVDNYLIYPSKTVDFNTISIVYSIRFKVFGILHNKLSLRKIEFAAKTLNANESNPITSRYGTNLIPYKLNEESGSPDAYDYKGVNPYVIDKESVPYLYLTRKSGIELRNGLNNLDRGLGIDINSVLDTKYSLSAIQMFLRSDLWGFPENPVLIFEIEYADDTLEFYIQANSLNADRATIFAKTKSNDTLFTELFYYLDGLYVADPTISIQRWTVLGISFPVNLNFNSYSGKINLKHLMTFNNISFYKGTNSQLEQQILFRKWEEINDQNWNYWDNSDWNNVLIKSRDSRYIVNAGEVYKNYVGTNKIIIDDDQGIYIETDYLKVFQDVVWQSSISTVA
jgi:hypothetical protein